MNTVQLHPKLTAAQTTKQIREILGKLFLSFLSKQDKRSSFHLMMTMAVGIKDFKKKMYF